MKTPAFSKKTSFPALHQMTYIIQQTSDELLNQRVGVGLSAVRIMSVLHERAAYSQITIASLVRQTESNVSRQLKSMRKEGLVRIVKNKKDARQKDVVITQKGKTKYKQAEKLLNAQQKNLLNKKDAAALEQIAEKLIKDL